MGLDLQYVPYTSHVVLTDGGVYDNLGLETVWKQCRTVLISYGGGATGPTPRPNSNWFRQVNRVLMVIDNQVGSMRKRQAIDGFISGSRVGRYWGIASHIEDFNATNALRAPSKATSKLAAVATPLKQLDATTQEMVINWGYAVCDAAVRRHVDPSLPSPSTFPYPAAGVG